MQGEEKRTLITGVVAGSENESYVARLLAGGDGAYLGASYPSVGPGRHSFPIVSGSTVAATIARGTAEVPAGGISIVNADPARVQHSYEINSADELQMAGLMPYMQSDLRASLTSGLDVKVLTDLLSGLTEVNDNTTMTLAKLLAKFGGAVDGKGAKNVNQVRILASNESYTFVSALNIANVGTFMSLVPHDRFLASSNMPDHGTANHGHGIAYRTGAGALQRLIVPVWRRGQLLRDTGQAPARGHHNDHRRHVCRRDRGQQRPASAVGIHQCLGHAATDNGITRAASGYATAACVSTMTRRATRTFRATW